MWYQEALESKKVTEKCTDDVMLKTINPKELDKNLNRLSNTENKFNLRINLEKAVTQTQMYAV